MSTTETGAGMIAAERRRQVEVEGFTPEHDSEHEADGALARAAACYATPDDLRDSDYPRSFAPTLWPWAGSWWKPCPDDRVRELVKAGALIAAEIDRIQAGLR